MLKKNIFTHFFAVLYILCLDYHNLNTKTAYSYDGFSYLKMSGSWTMIKQNKKCKSSKNK